MRFDKLVWCEGFFFCSCPCPSLLIAIFWACKHSTVLKSPSYMGENHEQRDLQAVYNMNHNTGVSEKIVQIARTVLRPKIYRQLMHFSHSDIPARQHIILPFRSCPRSFMARNHCTMKLSQIPLQWKSRKGCSGNKPWASHHIFLYWQPTNAPWSLSYA